MKKRVACLLTALMLCFTGAALAAEGNQLEITWTADADGLADYLKTMILPDSITDAQLKTLGAGLAKLLNTAQIRLNTRESGGDFSVRLKDETLLDMQLDFLPEEFLFRMPSLMDGYILSEPLPAEFTEEMRRCLEALPDTDWNQIGAALAHTADRWLSLMHAEWKTGSFMGDAFEGGAAAMTVTLDDANIAELADDLLMSLSNRLNPSIAEQLTCEGGLIQLLREKSRTVAAENRYSYIFRTVYADDQAEPAARAKLGYSLTVLEGDTQLATLSLGKKEKGWRAVLGLGAAQGNLYADFTLEQPAENEYHVRGAFYADPARIGFRAMKVLGDSWIIADLDERGTFASTADGWTWTAETLTNGGQSRSVRQGAYIAAKRRLDFTFSGFAGESDTPGFTMYLTCAPGESPMPETAALQRIAMDSVQDELGQEFAMRLFRLLPPELLTLMIQ